MSGEGGGNVEGLTAGGVAQASIENLKTQEKLKENQRKIEESIGNSLKATRKLLEIENLRLGTLEQQIAKLADGTLELAEIESKYGNLENYMNKMLEGTKLSFKQQQQLNAAIGNGNQGYEDALRLLQEIRGQQKLSEEFAEGIASATGSLASKMGIAADVSKTITGQFGMMVFTAKKLRDGDAFGILRDGALELFNPLNMVANFLDKLIKMPWLLGMQQQTCVWQQVSLGILNQK